MAKKRKKQSIKNYIQEKNLYQRRLLAAIVLIIGLVLLLIFRLVYIQLVQHKVYSTLSKKNYLQLLPIEPSRGLIYDRNGVLLAENLPSFSLEIIPDRTPDVDKTINELKKIMPTISDEEIKSFYSTMERQKSFLPITLKLNLTEEEAANFYTNQYQFQGVMITAHMIRNYPLNEKTAHVVGYVGRISPDDLANLDINEYIGSNFIGKTGIEKYYENLLHGKVGYNQVEVDAGGHVIRTLETIPSISGSNIYLTIDSRLQTVAEDALGEECGAVVALIPNTGEVLVLASQPSFNPNLFAKGINSENFKALYDSPDRPLYNRATRGQFTIASTIKPYIAIQGLDTGTISPDYTFFDKGWFQLPNSEHIYRDWNWKLKGHGFVNVTKAIIVSSDSFFYNLAVMLTITRIDDIMNRFGFGHKTGIDMPTEVEGLIPSPEWKERTKGVSWFPGDTVISGIGQGYMLATPLQLAAGVSALANRGLRYQSHLLLTQQTTDGKTIKQEPIAIESVILKKPEIWDLVIKAMEGVINSVNPPGTGRKGFGIDAKYTVAAKSGTGQVYSKKGGNEDANTAAVAKKLRNHSLFIAFAPVDHPEIAVAVVAEHSSIAPKVARQILDAYFSKDIKTTTAASKEKEDTNEPSAN